MGLLKKSVLRSYSSQILIAVAAALGALGLAVHVVHTVMGGKLVAEQTALSAERLEGVVRNRLEDLRGGMVSLSDNLLRDPEFLAAAKRGDHPYFVKNVLAATYLEGVRRLWICRGGKVVFDTEEPYERRPRNLTIEVFRRGFDELMMLQSEEGLASYGFEVVDGVPMFFHSEEFDDLHQGNGVVLFQALDERFLRDLAQRAKARVLLRMAPDLWLGAGGGAEPAALRGFALSDGEESHRLDGDTIMVRLPLRDSSSRLRGRLLASEDVGGLGRRLAELRGKTLGAIALALLGAWLMAWALFRRLSKPLEGLVRGAGRVASGDFGAALRPEGPEEIRALIEAFNRMASRVEASRRELEEANRGLERAVWERTVDFAQANESLRRELDRREKAEIENRKMQRALVLSEKLSAVGQLAAGVAHELNNPLGVILGFAQSMSRHVSQGQPLALPVGSIIREAVRCRNLVRDLLTFARQPNPGATEFDVREAVSSALALIETRAKMSSVEMVQELRETGGMLGNRNQIEQVVINLCNNAIDAMPNGGRLTVRAFREVQGGAPRLTLEVSDTGAGIPEELRSRVFDPFFTTKEVGKGTGLGLSLVHEIVARHGGEIALASEPGKGTAFSIRFPLREPERVGAQA